MQLSEEYQQIEKKVESMERQLRQRDKAFERLTKEIGYQPPETSESDRLGKMLELDRLLSEMQIAEGKALIARAKNMTADDMRQIGRAHLRHVNNRYRVKSPS